MSFTVTIDRIIPGGRGIAFHEGRSVFVPFSVPGDKLRIEQYRDRKSYLEAIAFEIVEPSPQRQQPPCIYFGQCGGCDFQQIHDGAQPASKREILLDALKRIAKVSFSPTQISVTTSPPWHYRNRLQLKIGRQGSKYSWGFFQVGSHNVVPLESCLIVSEPLWAFACSIRIVLESLPHLMEHLTGVEIVQGDGPEYLVDLQLAGEPSLLEATEEELQQVHESLAAPASLFLSAQERPASIKVTGTGHVFKTVGEHRYRVSLGSFFQVNDFMLMPLLERVTCGLSGQRALDLYCGVGFFTLALAKKFQEVLAVEVNPASSEDLLANLVLNRVSNCRFFSQDVTEFIRSQTSRLDPVDLLLVDPPRVGLAKEAVRQIAGIGAVDVVYVSCDPSTLARDLRVLLDNDYEVSSLDILDLFPQTHHLETVAKLRRREKG